MTLKFIADTNLKFNRYDVLIIVIKIPNDKNVCMAKISQTIDNFSKWHKIKD